MLIVLTALLLVGQTDIGDPFGDAAFIEGVLTGRSISAVEQGLRPGRTYPPEDLPKLVGRLVQLGTGSATYRGIIESVQPETLRVTVVRGSGRAEIEIQRARVRKIRLLE